MNYTEISYRKRWWQRVLKSRRKYFFERLRDHEREDDLSFLKIAGWIKSDVLYVFQWTLHVFRQINMFGSGIKKTYNVSYFQQFFQMMYLALVVRVNPRNFRKYRLFRKQNWQNVKDYTYAHANVQKEFSKQLFPEEVDLFLNKFLFSEFFNKHGFLTPIILAAFENGECIFFENPSKKLPEEDLFIKKMNGMMGIGAKKLVYRDGFYVDNEGINYDEKSVLSLLKDVSLKEYPVLLQKVIKNHPSWNRFTTGALATCRVVTWRLLENSEVKPFFATLRMPSGKMDVDNFSAGGIAAPVNLKNGILGKLVGSKPVNGFYEFSHHPDTKQKIEGTVIPEWDELLDFALNLHKKVSSPFVGWDICLTEQGFCVLEGSLEWGATTYECPHEKPLKHSLYPVIFEKWMESDFGSHE